MKQTKRISALLCGLLLFSALAFGKVIDIQGRWTSVPPVFWHGNMSVYELPFVELDFTSQAFLFVHEKKGLTEAISLCAYSYDGKELILRNKYHNQLQYGKGTASIETKVLTVQGFDEDVLPNGTYFYLGESYM